MKGTSAYKPLEDNTVRFALNVWAGWGPIILANDGFKPGKVWKTPDGKEFKVELVLIDDPVAMRDAYAAGEVHIGWATLDMVPLFMEGFVDKTGQPRDSRVMPRIYQQVDWSNGGDGIVVREAIKTVADLARQESRARPELAVALFPAQHARVRRRAAERSRHDLHRRRVPGGGRVQRRRRTLAAAVSWAPDIYNLADVEGQSHAGHHADGQQADRRRLVRPGRFRQGSSATRSRPGPRHLRRHGGAQEGRPESRSARKLMADGYNIPASETIKMFGDAHSTNWAENFQFFLNQNNPTNFERVWSQAYYLYRRIGAITHQPVPFDKVMDFSVIEKLGQGAEVSLAKGRVPGAARAEGRVADIQAESDEILTNTIVIQFFPNSWDLYKKINKDEDGKVTEVLYDPNVDNVLEEVAKLAGQFGAARIIIEGHTDSSRRGPGARALVKELSLNRANAVREALVNKYQLDPNRFAAAGMGWDGRPTRTIRTTTPRTAASKSRFTRPRSNKRTDRNER